MTRHIRKLELALSLTTWGDIDCAPKQRDENGVPRTIMLRGRYAGGRETLPYPCWWDETRQRWAGWPYAAVEPSFWMEMVPLPPATQPVVEDPAEDVFADAGAFFDALAQTEEGP